MSTPDTIEGRQALYREKFAAIQADGGLTKPLVHACCYHSGPKWFSGYAFSPDHAGAIAGHVSSTLYFAHHDMVTSGWKDDIYQRACPDGFEVLWLGDLEKEEIEGMAFAGKLRAFLLWAQGAEPPSLEDPDSD